MRQPDEDVFVIPDEWHDEIHPWRGVDTTPRHVTLDPSRVEALQRRMRMPVVRDAIAAAGGDADLIAAARAYLDGAADPVGAAVVATLHDCLPVRRYDQEEMEAFAHLWVAEHGLVFAATAAAELGGVFVDEIVASVGKKAGQYQITGPTSGVHPGQAFATGYAEDILGRVRALLAVADEQDYRDVVTALAARRRDDTQRIVTAYLVPTEADWVDEAVNSRFTTDDTEDPRLRLLLCSVHSVEQLTRLRAVPNLGPFTYLNPLRTAAVRVGPAIAPVLADLFDHDDYPWNALAVLGVLPTDEAFDLLVARLGRPLVHAAIAEAMRRFPVRALRRLALAVAGTSPVAPCATHLLLGHLAAHPDLADTVLPTLSPAEQAGVEAARQSMRWARDTLPRLLVEPPWTRERTAAAEPVVVTGLTAPAEQAVRWADGERERWAAIRTDYGFDPSLLDAPDYWERRITEQRANQLHPNDQPGLFIEGPDELVRPLLATWKPHPKELWRFDTSAWIKLVAARFEADALPPVLAVARSQPVACGEVLLPFVSAEVAELMADWLVRLRSVRTTARAWLRRHRTAAVLALVPAALGKAGTPRRSNAEAALRYLADISTPEEIVELARQHGEQAAAGIEAVLAADPLADVPSELPEIGDWLDVHLLPQVLLRDGQHTLPLSAVEHVITMLALSWPNGRYAGLDVVKQVCDPTSLAEFAWALYEQSREHFDAGESKADWCLPALGWLGNDDTVRRLTPSIRTWPGEGKHHKAVVGVDALVAIGTDTALSHLNSIATSVKYKGLRTKAQEKITELAEELNLSPTQLADRLVPDFGLDATGSLTLDYGPRQFTVGFDEQLKPFVTDANGKPLKTLPKPGARDDQNLAPAAHKRFTNLKKDVRTVAADQIRRLEQAMLSQRQWTTTEFHTLFVHHPLIWHITRRLVWTTGDSKSFRLAEDRTLADINDEPLTLPDTAQVSIAHPIHLGDAVKTWGQVFADYQILQPFPQLDRPVHALTDDERASTELTRFHSTTVPTGKVLGLERRGWERAGEKNIGLELWISRPLPDNRSLVVNLYPGILAGLVSEYPEQRIERVWLHDRPGGAEVPRPSDTFAVLDPITASEVLTDLIALTSE